MVNTRWGLEIYLIFICTISVSILTDKCVDARNLTATCSKQERLALLKFKNSVKDNYGMLSSWVGNDCCQWEKVTCDYATGNVVGLHLRKVTQPSYNELVGAAYREFNDELIGEDYQNESDQSLSKDHHLVSNKANSCLEKLRHLKYLDLSGNNFQGSHIPDFIGSFNYLSYLNLSNAGFGGIIPSHIGNLSYLKVLDLSSYLLYPHLMANNMAWVSGLSSLKYLNLNGVDLSGAQNLDRLLYRIPLLSKLSLSDCSLYDAHLGSHLNSSTKLANIRHLDLSWNSYQGQLPVFLQNMTSLAFLDLSGSNLTLVWNSGNLLSMFPSLSVLCLSDCGLQKINLFPTHYNFSTRSNIQHLDLSHNFIFGGFPSVLTNMTSLLSLDLSSNYLNSSIPVMPNLLKLDLSQNYLRIIEHVGIWRHCHMKELIVQRNSVEGEMVVPSTNVSECSQYALERLNLGNNILSGSIPESLGKLTSLRGLDLSFNKLTGPVLEALGKLRSLQVLDLSFNGLTGPIPEALEKLTSLQVLDVSFNHLIGRIPKFHRQLTKLRLAHNQFNGSIPESLGRFTDLTQLLLQSNRLTGPIPISLERLVSLQKFSVSSNFLGGTIPV
ncbi:putative non-specific serine/threonine protein kinase [Tanacetum coccineum]